jgi:hypothetical protein
MLLSVERRIRWGRIFGSDKTPRKKMGWTLELSFCATTQLTARKRTSHVLSRPDISSATDTEIRLPCERELLPLPCVPSRERAYEFLVVCLAAFDRVTRAYE